MNVFKTVAAIAVAAMLAGCSNIGAPKQELFAARAVDRGIKVGFVCVGAALDFLAGAQTRAPKSWQDLGLEWTWRLLTNPRRMAGRYTRCCLALGQIVMRTMRPSSPTLQGSAPGHRDGA